MIPAIPQAADLAACTTDAALLRMTGQGALPLLIVYHQSRLPIRLPRCVVVGIALRPLVCREFLDGTRTHVIGAPPPVMHVINTGVPESTLEYWPPAGRQQAV
ncbi:hypothetical protein [Deinococcus frigens]|uniref:hypothetical protein n=1 Tax=Deinococcus frigens TaxID=249403 RepID=UPI0004983D8E|nr:hypothetical protein [Deinococcus frigens]